MNILKFLIFAFIVFIIGFPINKLGYLLILVCSGIIIAVGEIIKKKKNWFIASILVLIVIILKFASPSVKIEEGHNIFVYDGSENIYEKQLPIEVFSYLREQFLKYYPVEKQCVNKLGCWKWYPKPKQTFAWSADGIWQKPKYSRIVDSIDFNSLVIFRLGTINDYQYNYYNFVSDIKRETLPFFVMYEFPENLLGSRLCWYGDVFVIDDNQTSHYVHNSHNKLMQCRTINTPNTKVFGISVNPKDKLQMKFFLPERLQYYKLLEKLIIYLFSFIVLFLLIEINNFNKLLVPLLSILSASFNIILIRSHLFFGYAPHRGGWDGIMHEGFGRSMVQDLLSGSFKQALMGVESIFYFMPGLRYFRTIEKIFFGDTNFGYVWFLMLFPLIVFYCLKPLMGKRLAFISFLIFSFTPIFERFGFALYLYVQQGAAGHAEALGYGLFLLGIGLVVNNISRNNYSFYSFFANIIFVGAIFVRPNLVIPSVLFLSLTALWLIYHNRIKDIIVGAMGFAFILLIPFHNVFFGKEFYLLTSSSFIPVNLVAPPQAYLNAFFEVIAGNFNGEGLKIVSKQMYSWNKWTDSYRFIPLFFVVFAIFKSHFSYWIRSVAVSNISMHFILLFYVASGRYAYLAWMLTFSIFIVVVFDMYVRRKNLNHMTYKSNV